MIIDLKKFIATEQPYWTELADMLKEREDDPHGAMDFDGIKRLHYLYQRASADLAKISTFSAEPAIREYLEALVSRAYAGIHASRRKAVRFAPLKWFWLTFPRTFRGHWKAFVLTLSILLVGSLFGGAALVLDSEAKAILMPFDHLQMDPAERVAREERQPDKDRLKGSRGTFSAFLMTHNTRIAILVLALGMTWGIGTVILLFTNGVMLGAVVADYLQAGEGVFLTGWLLPHGVVEIPAILLAGQAGLMLAGALIGRSAEVPLGRRMRAVVPDVVTLIGGVALMLVWAGVVESFFSQYHAPVIPYGAKIAFGLIELFALCAFFGFAGRGTTRAAPFSYISSLIRRYRN
jgi:uncharacterized membrane protein SpoIIM required for sporulation